jgi:anti-sigma factor RsiW
VDKTTLERLMIDEALGGLSTAVRALLAAYVRTNDAAQAQQARWRELGEMAREGMPEDAPEDILGALPVRAKGRMRQRREWWAGLAAAAGMLLGVGIGMRLPKPPTVGVTVAAADRAVAAVETNANVGGVRDFWSTRRLVATAMETRRQAQPAGTWNWGQIESESRGVK